MANKIQNVGAAVVAYTAGRIQLDNFADTIARRIFADANAAAMKLLAEAGKPVKGDGAEEVVELMSESETLNAVFRALSAQYRKEATAELGDNNVKAVKGIRVDGWDGLSGKRELAAKSLNVLKVRVSEAKRLFIANVAGHPAVGAWLAGDASRDAALKALGGENKADKADTPSKADAADFARMLEAAVNGLLDNGATIREIVNRAVAVADAKSAN